jgi:hypothetical protein
MKIKCAHCGNEFEIEVRRFNWNQKRGKKCFCSNKCVGLAFGSLQTVARRGHSALTPFTWFMSGIKRRDKKKRRSTGVTREDLKAQWDKQDGVCPYTGWKLILPESGRGWIWVSRKKSLGISDRRQASVDRIDSAVGYEKGNIQFVSVLANLAKRAMSEADFVEFCRAVAEKWKTPYVSGT